MLVSLVQDSKRKERCVQVLAGFKNAAGTIHACVQNDKQEKYRVTCFPDGTFTCRHEVNGKHEPCPSRHRKCYHVQAVERIACLFTDEGYLPKEQAPSDMQYLYFDDVEVAAVVGDKSYNEALSQAYEQLATTKKTSIAGSLSSRGLMRGQRTNYCGGQRIA